MRSSLGEFAVVCIVSAIVVFGVLTLFGGTPLEGVVEPPEFEASDEWVMTGGIVECYGPDGEIVVFGYEQSHTNGTSQRWVDKLGAWVVIPMNMPCLYRSPVEEP